MNSFNFAQILQQLSVALLPILAGMVCHELAHGWVAYKMGDPTAKLSGRLTFNPLRHLDAGGMLCFALTAASNAAMKFPLILGWARPVPIRPGNFRHFRRGMILVSLAGAGANLLLALVFSMLLAGVILSGLEQTWGGFLLRTCKAGVVINCSLACFNLMPIPPLDGSKVLACILPLPLARIYMRLERYGLLLVVVLLLTGFLGLVLKPVLNLTLDAFNHIIFWLL
ncbi:MAG: site-2 protease family protein [Deltaproteobacteria bacterium]|jgi:Zn-dependent protease|nr:site-2 protease family protein [Deltaproteobacteria bacterium]